MELDDEDIASNGRLEGVGARKKGGKERMFRTRAQAHVVI